MKKITLLLLAAVPLFSCQKNGKNDITYLLTRDSIQYFDVYASDDMKSPTSTLSFDASGKNEVYYFTPDGKQRKLRIDFDKPEDINKFNNWKLENDSTIVILGQHPHVIDRYSEDTIYLRSERGHLNTLVRVKGDPKVTEQSLYQRDSIIDDLQRKERVEREYKVQTAPKKTK